MVNYNDKLNLIGRKNKLFQDDIEHYKDELINIVSKSKFLVLGGAGSIGQAVTKEIFKRNPKKLHVVDISENNLVELVRDIRSSLGYIKGDFKTFALDISSLEYDAFFKSDSDYDYVLNLSALKHVRSEQDPFTLMRMIDINILNTEKPSVGLYLLRDTGLLDIILPEFTIMQGVETIDNMGHKDVFVHTLQVIDNAAMLTDKMKVRFAALVHDIAKPQTKKFFKDKGWTYHGHEILGTKLMRNLSKKMKLSNHLTDYLCKLIRLHLRPISLAKEGVTDSAVRRVMVEAGEDIDDLMILCRADITTKNPKKVNKYLNNFKRVEEMVQDVKLRDELRSFQSPVRGDEIMKTFNLDPGAEVGKIKKAIEDAILDGVIKNNYDDAYEYMLSLKKEKG